MYIDNFASLGTIPLVAREESVATERVLRDYGLATHAIDPPVLEKELLGMRIGAKAGAISVAEKKF